MKSVDLDIAKAKEMYAMSAADLAQAQVDFSGPMATRSVQLKTKWTGTLTP
jgi:hypothetical protein